jgi:flavin reductase (DIM6/NTAB) family NADH-FMN oxidoreductase RutF
MEQQWILSPAAMAGALGRIPSGCSILTVTADDRSTGVLLSWVQQASFDPPAVTFCVKRGRPVESLLTHGRRFVLNLMAEDAAALFRHFGRGFSLEENAFADIQTSPSEFGPLLHACPAQLGCEVGGKMGAGDHDVYLGYVRTARIQGDFKPYVHLRRNGLSY